MSSVIVFDLDGVLTSEEAYWDTAGLVLHELLYSPRYWNVAHSVMPYQPPKDALESHRLATQVLPQDAIVALKARSINSNWDTCYAAVVLNLINLLAALPERAQLLPLRPENAEWIATFRQQLASIDAAPLITPEMYLQFEAAVFAGYTGLDFIQRMDVYASER